MKFTEYLRYTETNSSRRITESSLETVHPKNKDELVRILQGYFDREEPDWKCDLNWIDTSKITDMSNLFSGVLESSGGLGLGRFNGDISQWDVSNVKDMSDIFSESNFNGDISKWDVSNVKSMAGMFYKSKFNGDLSKWDVSNVESMKYMFYDSEFNDYISKWDVSCVK